ncbi:MAG: hypothetical protein DWQ49_15250 [Bacteroidetes bacterium]|nr:MAG: hypothetical protein DWQ49_15250 [Bacteroidota bacterium]
MIKNLRTFLYPILLVVLILSIHSCTLVGYAVGSEMDRRSPAELIEYINTFNTPSRIKKEFPLILHDYWVKTSDGKDVHIIVSSMRKTAPKSFQTSFGNQVAHHDEEDAQAFIEFQLMDEEVVYWKSVGVYFNKKKVSRTINLTFIGHALDVFIAYLYVENL